MRSKNFDLEKNFIQRDKILFTRTFHGHKFHTSNQNLIIKKLNYETKIITKRRGNWRIGNKTKHGHPMLRHSWSPTGVIWVNDIWTLCERDVHYK